MLQDGKRLNNMYTQAYAVVVFGRRILKALSCGYLSQGAKAHQGISLADVQIFKQLISQRLCAAIMC